MILAGSGKQHDKELSCVVGKKGREKVIDWLKQLVNSDQHHAARQGSLPQPLDVG
jgi:hypothetical protein